MLQSFYWVVKNEIAGMAMPTAARAYAYLGDADRAAHEEFQREIAELKSHGIGAVVTLTENALDKEPLLKAGIEYLHIPVPDMTAPTQSQIDEFVHFVDQSLKAGKPVVAHCLGGSGRTGTMIACYLVSKRLSSNEAVRAVRKVRPSAIETYTQEEAIIEYAVTRAQDR